MIGGIGLRKRVCGVVAEKGVNAAIDAGNLIEAGLRGLARGGFAPGEFGGEFRNGEMVEHGKYSFNAKAQRRKDAKREKLLAAPRPCTARRASLLAP